MAVSSGTDSTNKMLPMLLGEKTSAQVNPKEERSKVPPSSSKVHLNSSLEDVNLPQLTPGITRLKELMKTCLLKQSLKQKPKR